MSQSTPPEVLRGVVPVAPTPFDDNDEVDYEGQRRVLDFMIDAGVDAICILANYSEQFSLTDDERERLTVLCLDHVAGLRRARRSEGGQRDCQRRACAAGLADDAGASICDSHGRDSENSSRRGARW